MEMILDLLCDMKDVLLIFFGAIISIITTWIANKQLHKMNLQQLAVQNKLETSKTAIGWLMEARSELSILIWFLERYQELGDGMMDEFFKKAAKLSSLENEAKKYINAIELYYNLNEIDEKYNVESMMPRLLSLQSKIDILKNDPRDSALQELQVALDEIKQVLQQQFEAITEIIETIRQDNLNYLK